MRALTHCAGIALLISFGSPTFLAAQVSLTAADLRVIQGTPLEKDYQHMLPDYLRRLASEASERRLTRLSAVNTGEDFKSWQDANRRKFLELIGGLPGERTPLRPRVVGEIAREGYVVRKIIFESLPDYFVPANLYVPTAGRGPFPAVLSPCGHSENGKAYEVYQHLFIGLAKRGYVVLTYDPTGQGERYEVWDFVHHRGVFDNPDDQHTLPGLQELLMGQNLARYFVWDGIRGLDYLTSLPEVNGERIGVTGSSGGGTLTTYISMLDPRVKAASIVTFISSLPMKIEARSLDSDADPEQDVPGLLAAGIDHTEFVGMIAPRPVLIGAATRDFFPIEGTRRTFGELQVLYNKLGVPERLKMVEFDHRHVYSQPLREAAYAWFDRWLKGSEGEAHEPEIVTERDEALRCTPTGQLITSLGGKRLYDFNRQEADRLLQQLRARRGEPGFRAGLGRSIRERLALPSDPIDPRARKIAEKEVGGLAIEKLLVETEPGIVAPVRIIRPKTQGGRLPAVIYLRDRRGEHDSPPLLASLAQRGELVASADVRGFGETWSPGNVVQTDGNYFQPWNGADADFAYAAAFLGRPLLGMRVWDALNVAAYVRSRPDVDPQRVRMVGRGWGGMTALFSAALDPAISGAALEGIPASYAAIARAELYDQPASLLLPNVLLGFDLEDVLSALAPRPLLLMNPQDPLTRRMYAAEAFQALAGTREAYRVVKAERAFTVQVTSLESDTLQELERWLLEP